MNNFRLLRRAQTDLDKISARLERDAGIRIADHVLQRLFDELAKLQHLSATGHRRPELGRPELLFHTVFEYVIIFRREPRVVVLRVLHGKRDLAKILR